MSFAGVCIVGSDGWPSGSVSDVAAAGTAAHGYYLLVIDGYSGVKQRIPNGESIASSSFRVGGRSWYIDYYPNGEDSDTSGWISIYLCLDDNDDDITEPVKVRFQFSLGHEVWKQDQVYINNGETYSFAQGDYWGWGNPRFFQTKVLERSKLLRDQDCLTIRCDVNIVDLDWDDATAAASVAGPAVPPSDFWRNLSNLLHSKESTDVMFEVGGVTFAAHRCILAARSAVFKAELFGPMKEGVAGSVVRIDDMEAHVFMSLLTFIYTDLFPESTICRNADNDDYYVLCQHLLVAADRYDIQRLKLICEAELCRYIKVSTVADILALAEQHLCRWLKEACLEFLETPTYLRNLSTVVVSSVADTIALAEQLHCCESKKSCLEFLKSHAALREASTEDGFEYITRDCLTRDCPSIP